jgi:cephalosporin hydroxylase
MSLITRLASSFRKQPEPSRSNPTRNPQCTEFEVDAWHLSGFVVGKLVPVVGVHPFPLHELMLLSAAVCRVRPRQIFEWGTHIGKSARAFHETALHFDLACEIHSVDLPDDVLHVEHPSSERGKLVRGLPRIHLHQGDGVDVSLRIWRETGRQSPVLFFIDGDHAMESVFRELSRIVAEIPDAAVLLHDTFYQSADANYNVGPHRAIDAVLRERPGRFRRLDSALGLPGMTLLYPV